MRSQAKTPLDLVHECVSGASRALTSALCNAMCPKNTHAVPADWWLEGLAALRAEAEAACKAGAGSITWPPPSMLRCWCTICNIGSMLPFAPAYLLPAMVGFGRLNTDVHKRLLSSNAAAAQRTEAAAVAAARCCLSVARAIDGWQGELAASQQMDARWNALSLLEDQLAALNISPAFSCAAAGGRGSARVPGRQAVAAVIEALQLAAEAVQAVVGIPSLRDIHLPDYCEGGATPPAAICVAVSNIVNRFLWQRLPGGQVPLTRCIESEQVQPMLRALPSVLRVQVRWRTAWPRCLRQVCVSYEQAWQGALACVRPLEQPCSLPTLLRMCATSAPPRCAPGCAAQGTGVAAGARPGRQHGHEPGSQHGGQHCEGCIDSPGAPDPDAPRSRQPGRGARGFSSQVMGRATKLNEQHSVA